MIGYIYRITSNEGHTYVGLRKNKSYFNDTGYMSSSFFKRNNPQLTWKKELLRIAETGKELDLLETIYIARDKVVSDKNVNGNRGNYLSGSFGAILGHGCSEETRKKMSDWQKGKPKSEEMKKKLSESRKGKKFGPRKPYGETKAKGKPKSDEHKKHLSEARKGKTFGKRKPYSYTFKNGYKTKPKGGFIYGNISE